LRQAAALIHAQLAKGLQLLNGRAMPSTTGRRTVFFGSTHVFHGSSMTPWHYACICHDLEKRGAMIPVNDIWTWQ
jgi:hypothetical protein